MNTKGLNVKYNYTSLGTPPIPEYDLIETFFERVDYTEKAVGIYEFDFYDKEGGLHQFSINLKNVYTDYRKWSERFFIYFVTMGEIVLKDTWILRRVVNSRSLGLSGESIGQYIEDLKKKAFQFLLDLTLKEIELININNKRFFIEQIERSLRSYKKKDLAGSLGLKDTCNFFISFLASLKWHINNSIIQQCNIVKGPFGKPTLKTTLRFLVSFDHSDSQLQVDIENLNPSTCNYVLQDLEALKEKRKFTPIFTDSSIYTEPEITKLGEYNILNIGDETIYLTDSFIIGPVDGYALFEKSKLTVAGVEKILNISPSELKAKLTYAIMNK